MHSEKTKYEFDSSLGILYKFYFGEITIVDITNTWEYAINNNIIPENTKGFILDYRNANFKIKEGELSQISNYYRNHLSIFGNKKIAIITENPKDIVVPFLVETEDDGYSSRPFTSTNAAIKWISIKH